MLALKMPRPERRSTAHIQKEAAVSKRTLSREVEYPKVALLS